MTGEAQQLERRASESARQEATARPPVERSPEELFCFSTQLATRHQLIACPPFKE